MTMNSQMDNSVYPQTSDISEFIPQFPEEKWQSEESDQFVFILASNVTHIGSYSNIKVIMVLFWVFPIPPPPIQLFQN